MKRPYVITLSIVSIIVLALLIFFLLPKGEPETIEVEVEETEPECRLIYGLPADSFVVVAGKVSPNTYLSQIFTEIGASRELIAQLNTLGRDCFDVRSIRAGCSYSTLYSHRDTTTPLYWVYEKSLTDYVVFDFRDSLRIYTGSKPTRIETETVHAEISSSLWNATIDNGLPPGFAVKLSDIYSWTIDFFGLQKGDYFSA
ncbi:hypothetical protein LJB98_03905, partial [Bacteroidales bacterium OttesenSCG-928-M11]|nr:hypothetical protein [Bacteroidales bacterium OttesenSCG-928-M11]